MQRKFTFIIIFTHDTFDNDTFLHMQVNTHRTSRGWRRKNYLFTDLTVKSRNFLTLQTYNAVKKNQENML